MQKNENQNRWAPIVVGITKSYPGLYLHPWALRGESHTIFFPAQQQRQEVKKTVAAICWHVQEMCMEKFTWSIVLRHERTACSRVQSDLICVFLFVYSLYFIDTLSSTSVITMCVLHHLWSFSKRVSLCGIHKVTVYHCYYNYAWPAVCKQWSYSGGRALCRWLTQ